MNLLKLSWKNFISKPLSMVLSLVLFALGVGMISLLLVLNKQFQEQFEKNLAGIDLVIGAKGSPLQLILCSMYHLDSPTGNISIKEARAFLNPKHPLIKKAIPMSLGDSYKGYRIVGTTHDMVELYDGKLEAGPLWEKDFEVTLGAAAAEQLDLYVGDTFNSSHGFVIDENLEHNDTEPFRVVSVLESTGSVLDQLILTNSQSIWKVHADHGPALDSTVVQSEPTAPKALIDELDQDITSILVQFRNRNYRTLNLGRNINESTNMQAALPAIEINRLHEMMGVGEDALEILALIIVIVSGFSVFISLYSSLRERRYELALMRVMGASRYTLFFLIILEGVLLAAIGFALGILLSHVGMEVLAGYMKEEYRYSFDGWQFLKEEWYLLLASLGIGVAAAIIPAIQASRTDISDTLTET